jgi:hypothetical protein
MHRFFALLTLLTVCGCAAAGTSALTAETLRANEEEVDYIRSNDLKPYIQVAIIHNHVVRGMSREDVRFVKGAPKDSTVDGDSVTWRYGPVTRSERFVFEGGEVVDKK